MARELSTLAKRVERGVGKVRPGLRTKAFFTLIRWMQKRGWNEADQVYWREKGWTGRASLEESLTLPGARGEVLAPNDGQMDGFVLQ